MKSPLQTAGAPNLPFTFQCSKVNLYKTDYFVYVAWYRTTTSSDPGDAKGGVSTPFLITNLDGTTCTMDFRTTYGSAANAVEEMIIPLSCSSIAFSGNTYGGVFGNFAAGGA